MPLVQGSSRDAVSENIRREKGAGKPQRQAVAIALDVARRSKRASGGLTTPKPAGWQTRNEARGMMHTGPIGGITGGRTDVHKMNVPGGSYVVPAYAVSHLGENNTAHGMAKLGAMFHPGGPFGSAATGIKHGAGAPHAPKAPKLAKGGKTDETGKPVPIIAASGEFVIPESIVRNIGRGDIDFGHRVLDHWILSIKKEHAKTIRKLPGPAKS